MSLVEAPFLLFLALAVLGLRAAGRWPASQLPLLAVLSLLFYATWNPFYLAPLLVTVTVDWAVGRALGRTSGRALRRLLVGTSLVVDLSLLGFFKYWNLLAESAGGLLFGSGTPPFRVLFAAGISFYTFQSLSYVVDVYRGDQESVPSWVSYLAFVSFFPTILAGPITRADTFFPQVSLGLRPPDADAGSRALFLIALGFFKKCVLADTISVNLVDRVFELPRLFTSAEVLAGVYGYAVQIYCDFSGYSDIAIGAALLVGLKLKDNFNAPYRSADLAEFWRRWHISLSTWLRDYLFFSLPGKRPGSPWPYLNLVVTFTLGGLWHGPSLTYVVWGLMHGAGLAVVRYLGPAGRPKPRPAWRRALGILLTFHFVAVTWVFFRSATVSGALDVFRVIAEGRGGLGNLPLAAVLATVAGLASQAVPEDWYRKLLARFTALPAPAQAAILLASAAGVRLASGSRVAPFIYFSY